MGRFLVGKTSEIKHGQMKKISIDEKEVVIANFDGNFFAVDDTCTHAGASLSEGKLDDTTITCDWHGAQFDCKNGKLKKFPVQINDLKSYKLVIESDDIFVDAQT